MTCENHFSAPIVSFQKILPRFERLLSMLLRTRSEASISNGVDCDGSRGWKAFSSYSFIMPKQILVQPEHAFENLRSRWIDSNKNVIRDIGIYQSRWKRTPNSCADDILVPLRYFSLKYRYSMFQIQLLKSDDDNME
jgi:hypothetical protein